MLMRFARFEQQLKWIALALGILSTIAIIKCRAIVDGTTFRAKQAISGCEVIVTKWPN